MTFKPIIRDEAVAPPKYVKENGELYSKEEVRQAIKLANNILRMLKEGSKEAERILKQSHYDK